MTRPALFATVLAIALVSSTGCRSLGFDPVRSPVSFEASGEFRAGAARVDVTPPAGISTWGHGPDALESRGHRGRLHCRIIYLEDRRGERVVLMPCDFAAMSVNLPRLVAAAVVERVGVGADRIVMSATHTHGGPGNYFAAHNYHRGLSSEPSGYDPRLVAWLVERLAAGVVEAHASARPARIAWTRERINDAHGAGPSIGVNRSVVAHCANTNPMGAAMDARSTCTGAAPDANAEVEGRLDLLRIDAIEGEGTTPLALFASYPVHGTVVPHSNEFFEADLWGFAARYLEAPARRHVPFVAALANGAEGDVRPNYGEQTWDEARRVGELLGRRIEEVYLREPVWETDPTITVAYRDLRLPGATTPGDVAGGGRMCPQPQFGRVAPGGSEEGRTTGFPQWLAPDEGTTSSRRRGCHAPAEYLPFSHVAAPGYPHVAPLIALAIGDALVFAYPWEMTTTAGIRLRERVERGDARGRHVVLVGLANDYLQYLTTPEEYDQQHYEGASTYYGRGSLDVVTGNFVSLVAELDATIAGGPSSVRMERLEFPHTERRALIPDDEPWAEPVVDVDACGLVRFESHRALEARFAAGHPATLGMGTLIARVERRNEAGTYVPHADAVGAPVDDTHEDVLFEYLGELRGRPSHRYRIVWVPAPGTPPGDYRIVVVGREGLEHASPSMSFAGPGR